MHVPGSRTLNPREVAEFKGLSFEYTADSDAHLARAASGLGGLEFLLADTAGRRYYLVSGVDAILAGQANAGETREVSAAQLRRFHSRAIDVMVDAFIPLTRRLCRDVAGGGCRLALVMTPELRRTLLGHVETEVRARDTQRDTVALAVFRFKTVGSNTYRLELDSIETK